MALLLNLYLGHLLGDFVFQPGALVVAKRKGIAGLFVHVGIIGACTTAILFDDLPSLWNIVVLAMAAHLAIEVITIRLRVVESLTGLTVFIIDQSLHVASLVALVWIAAPIAAVDRVETFGVSLDVFWVAFLCALVAVTFMGSIVVFEMTNSVGPDSWNMEILPFDRSKLMGMAERGAALGLAAGLGAALMPVAFVPRLVYAFTHEGEERSRQLLIASAGLAICVAGWLMVLAAVSKNATV